MGALAPAPQLPCLQMSGLQAGLRGLLPSSRGWGHKQRAPVSERRCLPSGAPLGQVLQLCLHSPPFLSSAPSLISPSSLQPFQNLLSIPAQALFSQGTPRGGQGRAGQGRPPSTSHGETSFGCDLETQVRARQCRGLWCGRRNEEKACAHGENGRKLLMVLGFLRDPLSSTVTWR